MSENFRPITSYLENKEELLEQVFLSLTEREIRHYLPDAYKHLSMSQIKSLCFVKLSQLSTRKILEILEGRDPPSCDTSSSETSDLKMDIQEETNRDKTIPVAHPSYSDNDILEIKVADAEMDEMTGLNPKMELLYISPK